MDSGRGSPRTLDIPLNRDAITGTSPAPVHGHTELPSFGNCSDSRTASQWPSSTPTAGQVADSSPLTNPAVRRIPYTARTSSTKSTQQLTRSILVASPRQSSGIERRGLSLITSLSRSWRCSRRRSLTTATSTTCIQRASVTASTTPSRRCTNRSFRGYICRLCGVARHLRASSRGYVRPPRPLGGNTR